MNNSLTGISETSYLSNLWLNLEEMPINNWRLILETGDLKYLFKSKKGRVSNRCIEHWDTLQQEYLDEFGLDETYKQLLRFQNKLMQLNLDFVISRDRFLLNLIKMTEADIDNLKSNEEIKFYDMLDHVEKYKGFAIDPDKYSTKKWYYSLKNLSKNGEENKG